MLNRLSVILLCFGGAIDYSAAAQDSDTARKPAVISFTTENDFFGGGTDRNYSNGIRLERVSAADDVHPVLGWVGHRLPWLDLDRTDLRQGFAISHAIFTPEDIAAIEPDPADRPYAGWLAISGTVTASNENFQDTLQLNVGVVGPAANGEFIQNSWHQVIGVDAANGWDAQLKDELGIEIVAQRLQVLDRWELPFGVETDFAVNWGGALGNVRTYANAGLTARIGWDLGVNYSPPPRIRPALSGGGEFIPGTKEDPFGGYLFVGIDGRGVVRDMFFDGNPSEMARASQGARNSPETYKLVSPSITVMSNSRSPSSIALSSLSIRTGLNDLAHFRSQSPAKTALLPFVIRLSFELPIIRNWE